MSQWSPYAPPMFSTALIAGAAAVYSWRRRARVPAAGPFAVVAVSTFLYALGAAGDLSSATLEGKIFWLSVEYAGFCAVPVASIVFALHLVGKASWITFPRLLALSALPAATTLCMWVPPLRGLAQTPSVLVPRDGYVMRHAEGGPLFWTFALYGYACLAASVALYVQAARSPSVVLRKQGRALAFASLIPWGANAIYLAGFSPDPLLDLTPYGYAFSVPLYLRAITRAGLLDLIPVARDLVFEQLADPVVVADSQARVVDLNPAAAAIFGGDSAALAGRPLAQVQPALVGAEEELELAGRSWAVRRTPLARGGEVIALHDVTEQIAARQAQADAVRAAEANARARGDFLARMSHEIRTPLFGVLGVVELLADGTPAQSTPRLLEALQRSGAALLSVVNEILEFSRLDLGAPQLEAIAFSPGELVQDLEVLFRPLAEARGIRLAAGAAPGPRVVGDAGRVRQVLTNLLANAIKFTERGEVVLSVESFVEGDRVVSCFSVRDTGPGIAPDAVARIFEPFAQAEESISRRYGGTGLGLAISQRLAHHLGGTLELDTAPGRGSTFRLRVALPAAPAGEQAVAPEVPLARPPRVLLVDDHPVNRLVGLELLAREGCEVTCAVSGTQALSVARAGRFDLVLLDLHMPELDGGTAARLLRGAGFEGTIALFTADVLAAREQVKEGGAVDRVLAKPFSRRELRDVLSTAVAASTSAPPRLDPRFANGLRAAVLDAFLQTSADELQRIRHAAAAGEWASVSDTAHELAGSAGIVGALRVAEACRTLSLAARRGDAREAVSSLERVYPEEIAALTGADREVST